MQTPINESKPKLIKNLRVCAIRSHGKITFLDLKNESGILNAFGSKDLTVDYDNFKRQIFLGCVVQCEVSETVNKYNSPIYAILKYEVQSNKNDLFPEEYPFNGIKDVQIKYKKRALDLATDLNSFGSIKKRYQLIAELKNFFRTKNFNEVDTPILEQYYGGANATPFTTLCRYNKKNYYLRVSLEFPLKKLIIAGFNNVFQVGSVFRNEDVDRTHTSEFTTMESYSTELSFEETIDLIQQLYRTLYFSVHNTYFRKEVDLRLSWPRYNFEQIEQLKRKHNCELSELQKKVLPSLYHLIGVEDIPLGVYPHIGESYVDNVELTTFYQEQNDADRLYQKCKDSAWISDVSFVQALKCGMASTVGLGVGIDRLVSSILRSETIREIQPFPLI
jgi:lysyl-tRNA synthetase class 2